MYASSFRAAAQQCGYSCSPDLSPSECFMRENLNPLMYLSPIENEEILHQRVFFKPIDPFKTSSVPLKCCDSSWQMYLRALMQMEDILSII